MTIERLAELLASYEMDAPHTGEWLNEPNPRYPKITWQELFKWANDIHQGDCVNLPASCPKCFAEDIIHKATWIINNQ